MERLLKQEHIENLNKGYMCGTELQIACMNKLAEYENTGLEPKEIEQLKSELEELKKNAIVPKFKVGQDVWGIYYDYYLWEKDGIRNFVISKIEILTDRYRTNAIFYTDEDIDNSIIESNIFSSKSEAEEALRKLEEV